MEIELAVRLPDGRRCKIEKAFVGKWNLKEGLYTPFTHYPIERMGAKDKPHPKVWADEDKRFLLENWGKIPLQELAQRLGITPKAVRKKYALLKHSPI